MLNSHNIHLQTKAASTCVLIISLQFFYAEGNYLPCRILESDPSADLTRGIKKWPNQRVPYTLDSNMHSDARNVLGVAFNDYHKKTCIRFVEKSSSDYNYIHIKLDYKNNCCCGQAQFCFQGNGKQDVFIAPYCNYAWTYIHELGHAICLHHEHARPDRDSYLKYSECTNPSEIEKIQDYETTRSQIYDYYSLMHYDCGGCHGIPTNQNVKKCGQHANPIGLSVIDADRINEVYNCQDCFQHRWYRIDQLTPAVKATLVNFAADVPGHEPTYLCRGVIYGKRRAGIYIDSAEACLVSYDIRTYWVFYDIQVFGLPNGPNSVGNYSSPYQFYETINKQNAGKFLGIATELNYAQKPVQVHAAVHELVDTNGNRKVVIGHGFSDDIKVGFFPNGTESFALTQFSNEKIEFYVIGCEI